MLRLKTTFNLKPRSSKYLAKLPTRADSSNCFRRTPNDDTVDLWVNVPDKNGVTRGYNVAIV